MQFRFDANQEYQIQAIEAVAALLEGQPPVEPHLTFTLTQRASLAAVTNRLDLDDEAVLDNLKLVQARNGLPIDDALETIEEQVETPDGPMPVRFANFSVEMETGTGKTYVYLRTALELYRRFRQRKFIVVVPSVAIREGVLKTLQITEEHFKQLYGNVPYRYYVYDSANLSRIRQFALSDGVEIMVMTLDSFNKDANVIRRTTDRLQGETPIELVRATRPVLILDEPQNMESEKSIAALAALHPLFALRYSATHRNPYNVVYRLTPYDAYRAGLVKRIEVAGVTREDDANLPFIRLESIKSTRTAVTARVTIHKLMKTGVVKESTVTTRPGDSLADKANRPEYADFVVEEINPSTNTLYFTSQAKIGLGESRGADKEAVFKAQIRYTIETHMRKQARLRDQGIKVLSLFFIDRVANFADDDGIIRTIFDRAFDELKETYPEWREREAADVRAAYFAQQRRRGGGADIVDSVTGAGQRDVEAYDLIMREKERLLSFEEPAAFIFSHSALREGWDNPNVFQICTLNQSVSTVRKRQEIGRGVRLAVDQVGERVWDEDVNILTVIANESYQRYVDTLQREIADDYGSDGLPPKPANARLRATARLKKERVLSPEFKELWERINQRTRYMVRIDTERLIENVLNDLEAETINPPRMRVSKAQVDVRQGQDRLVARLIGDRRGDYDSQDRSTLPNLVDVMSHLLEFTTPPAALSRRTLTQIFTRLSKHQQQAALANPHEFATRAVKIIKNYLPEQLVDGVTYEKVDEWYEMARFEAEIESWEDKLVPAERSLYDQIPIDSDVERRFVESMELREDVRCYVKLPNWFTVTTPVGEYNPDWAMVMEDRDEHGETNGRPLLYLVRETKSSTNVHDLRPDERRKISCGMRHFGDALQVDYRVVTNTADLP